MWPRRMLALAGGFVPWTVGTMGSKALKSKVLQSHKLCHYLGQLFSGSNRSSMVCLVSYHKKGHLEVYIGGPFHLFVIHR